MPIFRDLTGQRFNRLTAIKCVQRPSHNHHKTFWLCKCDCGNESIVDSYYLTSGHTKSCGCLAREIAVTSNTTHGMSGTRLYAIYAGMKSRCLNKNRPAFYRYGGRGITICNEWVNDPQAFLDWALASGYTDKLTIERKDNSKGYSPDNCCWATDTEQCRNRRSNVYITIKNQTKTATDWAKDFGISRVAVLKRIKRGWNPVDAVIMPLGKGGKRSQDDFNRAELLFFGSK